MVIGDINEVDTQMILKNVMLLIWTEHLSKEYFTKREASDIKSHRQI